MKRAIVTGGAGFIGSHLAEFLIQNGFEVHIIDDLSAGKINNIPASAITYTHNICSDEAKQLICDLLPEYIFHLAAQADVTRSIIDPQYDADVNVLGTINMLEAAREAKVKKFIFSSTSAVYGSLQKQPITEDDPALPISYYGLSKWAAEQYIRLYAELYELPYTILRYGNVYGPRQTSKGEGGVIAVFMEKVKAGSSLNIHGDGEQTRDFIFVQDIVRANFAAIKKAQNETINISTGRPVSINKLIEKLQHIHIDNLRTVRTPARIGDIKHSSLSNMKACQLLDWIPQTEIGEGLFHTYNWKMDL